MKIGVYGLGRFGLFWGEKLSEIADVYGYSRNPKNLGTGHIEQVDYQQLLECDVIVLCVAISAIEEVVNRLASDIRPGTLVMDTCSVKVYPVRIMEKLLPLSVSIIGTHPMFGPDSGRDGIRGLPFVYSPVRCSEEIATQWRYYFAGLGVRVISMTPDEHDMEAAFTQGVTHYIGRILKEMDLKESDIATMGYNRVLEIIEQTCNDPLQLFYDLQRYNPHTNEMREKLLNVMKKIMNLISPEQS